MSSHRTKVLSVIALLLSVISGVGAENVSHVRATLIADVKTIQPGIPFWAGVQLEMDPGWHTYWVNPGEAGLATRIHWKLPQGLDVGPTLWPEPEKIAAGGVVSYGYEGRVLLMAKVQSSSDLSIFDPAMLKVRVDWMECSDICVPGSADLALELPVKVQAPEANDKAQEAFSQTQASMPISESNWRMSLIDTPSEWRLMFRPPVGTPCLGKEISFYPDKMGLVPPSAPQKWEWVGDGCRLVLKKATLSDRPTMFSGLVVRKDGWDPSGTRHALQVLLPIK